MDLTAPMCSSPSSQYSPQGPLSLMLSRNQVHPSPYPYPPRNCPNDELQEYTLPNDLQTLIDKVKAEIFAEGMAKNFELMARLMRELSPQHPRRMIQPFNVAAQQAIPTPAEGQEEAPQAAVPNAYIQYFYRHVAAQQAIPTPAEGQEEAPQAAAQQAIPTPAEGQQEAPQVAAQQAIPTPAEGQQEAPQVAAPQPDAQEETDNGSCFGRQLLPQAVVTSANNIMNWAQNTFRAAFGANGCLNFSNGDQQ